MKQLEGEDWNHYYERLLKKHLKEMKIIKHGNKTFEERKKLRVQKINKTK